MRDREPVYDVRRRELAHPLDDDRVSQLTGRIAQVVGLEPQPESSVQRVQEDGVDLGILRHLDDEVGLGRVAGGYGRGPEQDGRGGPVRREPVGPAGDPDGERRTRRAHASPPSSRALSRIAWTDRSAELRSGCVRKQPGDRHRLAVQQLFARLRIGRGEVERADLEIAEVQQRVAAAEGGELVGPAHHGLADPLDPVRVVGSGGRHGWGRRPQSPAVLGLLPHLVERSHPDAHRRGGVAGTGAVKG